ncbi:MAG: signal peptidase I [Parvibaculales bacterium]
MPETKNQTEDKKDGAFTENVKSFLYALIIALLIRTLLFQPFSIPSGSMLPTLLIGDYLFVSKTAYGYSRHSIPFSLPLFEGRILEGEVERGDVAVFKLPRDGRTDYIKRVIGLPGERIQIRDGLLHINGVPVQRRDLLTRPEGTPEGAKAYLETLPNGVSYVTLDMGNKPIVDHTGVYVVPEGHYFVMGDNRDNSQDSRFLRAVGYIPYENFVGKAKVKFYSFDDQTRFWQVWRYPVAIRWHRLFGGIE